MKLKSYHAETVEAAVRLARVELGEDAVFLGSRRSDENGATQRYEVTFALLENDTERAEGAESQADRRPPAEAQIGESGSEPPQPHEVNGVDPAPTRPASAPTALAPNSIGLPHWRKFVSPSLAQRLSQDPDSRLAVKGASATKRPASNAALERPGAPPSLSQAPPISKGQQTESEQWVRLAVLPAKPEETDADPRPVPRELTPSPAPGGSGLVAGQVRPAPPRVGMMSTSSAAAPARAARASEAYLAPAVTSVMPSQPPRLVSNTPLSDFMGRVSAEIQGLREALANGNSGLKPHFLPSGELLSHPTVAQVYSYLIGQEVEPGLAAQLIGGLQSVLDQGGQLDKVREQLVDQVRSLCRTENTLGQTGSDPRIVALVGPPGVGKTSTLAKLAVRYGLGSHRRVHLYAVDPQRVGAMEQLEAFAALLESPLTSVTEPETLPRLVERLVERSGGAEMVMIDTLGYSVAEWPQARNLAKALTCIEAVDTHLVLSLTAKPQDLQRNLERYRVFQPRKLLFTSLDETECHGAVLNQCARTKLPISFFSTGQRVPEDLTPATEPFLTDLIVKKNLLS